MSAFGVGAAIGAVLGCFLHGLSYACYHRPIEDVPTVKVEELSKLGRTGDVLVFSGNSMDSSLIKMWSCSDWSHVGILWIDPRTKIPYVWHSDAACGNHDALLDEVTDGVQLNDLRVYTSCYSGSVYWRPLAGPPVDPVAVKALMEATAGQPFNYDTLDLFRCTWGRREWLPVSASRHALFCSEFAAHVLQELGVLEDTEGFVIGQCHPRAFSDADDGDLHELPWAEGRELVGMWRVC